MKAQDITEKDVYKQFPQLSKISDDKFPKHLLIIPDGNGRWAKKIHKMPAFGHKTGFKVIQKAIRELQDLPIGIITVWAFSADNWKRESDEVNALMRIFDAGLKEAEKDLMGKNVRFVYLGRRDRIPAFLRKTVEDIEKKTKDFGPKIFCIALDFSGQDQEIRMMQKIQGLPPETEINVDLIEKLRDAGGGITPAYLIVRTSGEQRTSDLGWLSTNSEFYSIQKLLPETKTSDFVDALIDYSKRERRFGARLK